MKYRKPYRIKRKKSILKSRFFLLLILFLIISGGIFYLICFFPLFQIKEIEILGNESLSSENIRNFIIEKAANKFLFLNSRSIFLINLNEIRKKILKEFPQISKIDFKRKLPDKILVKIEERKPIAIFPHNENYYLIDREGIIFDKISDITAGMFQIKKPILKEHLELGERIIEKEKIPPILEIESFLKKDLKILVSEISIASEERINVETSEGWKIYFNLKKDVNWQLTKLGLVLKEKIPPEKRKNLEYIDLRFEKIYVFPEINQSI